MMGYREGFFPTGLHLASFFVLLSMGTMLPGTSHTFLLKPTFVDCCVET